MTETQQDVKVSDLARQYHLLRIQRDETQELMDNLAAQIREQVPVGTKLQTLHTDVPLTISVRANVRFSEDRAREVLPHDLLMACTRPAVDSQLVKATVAPALYKQCQVQRGEPVVSVKELS